MGQITYEISYFNNQKEITQTIKIEKKRKYFECVCNDLVNAQAVFKKSIHKSGVRLSRLPLQTLLSKSC